VDDLRAATERFRDVGFDAVSGGRHVGLGTENAIIRFDDGYLELLAVYDERLASAAGPNRRALVELLQRGSRAAGYALAVRGLDAFAKRLSRAGLGETMPTPMRRVRPDGTTLTWRVLHPTGVAWARPWPFFIEWDMPDAARLQLERPGRHANGVSGVASVGVAVDDLGAAAALYEAFGVRVDEAPDRADIGARRARCEIGDLTIELLSPSSADGALRRVMDTAGQGLFEIVLRASDAARARAALAAVTRLGARLTVVPA
jgi:hypothetical protein